MAYKIIQRGSKYSTDYRVFFRNETGPISPLHDIPLLANSEGNIFNVVVEMPRWTNAEMEIAMDETLNPVKQVIETGKPKFVPNCFPYHGYMWNYGALPQTWENPNKIIEPFSYKGDNNPLDVIEIGERVAKLGDVMQVKVLGAIALLNKGVIDFKIVAINVNDPLAYKLANLIDVTEHCPMLMEETFKWFKICDVPNGKPQNQIAFDERFVSTRVTNLIIDICHKQWKARFGKNSVRKFSFLNTTLRNMYLIDQETAQNIIRQTTPRYRKPCPVDASVNKIHYLSNKIG